MTICTYFVRIPIYQRGSVTPHIFFFLRPSKLSNMNSDYCNIQLTTILFEIDKNGFFQIILCAKSRTAHVQCKEYYSLWYIHSTPK